MPEMIAALTVVLLATRELVPANEFASFHELERIFTASVRMEHGRAIVTRHLRFGRVARAGI